MSLKKIVLILFSCVFFATMVNAEIARSLAQATEKIKQHTEPRFRNTFMVFSKDEVKCLALNVYHEARNESLSGKIAVILVTMNRVADERFPGTICEVVHQGKHYYHKKLKKRYPLKNMCQFSWYCDGRVDVPNNKRAWTYSQALAEYVLKRSMLFIDFTEGATHYHAGYIPLPKWAKQNDFIKTVTIDTHLFYRWEG
jgi:spore germination cell wall hydrolase CwlJ-like protein